MNFDNEHGWRVITTLARPLKSELSQKHVVECCKESCNSVSSKNLYFSKFAAKLMAITTLLCYMSCTKRGIYLEFPILIVVIVVIVYSYYLLKALRKSLYTIFYNTIFRKNIRKIQYSTDSPSNSGQVANLLHFNIIDTDVSKIKGGISY